MGLLIAAAVAGQGLKTIADFQTARAQAKALKQRSLSLRAQAVEVQKRSVFNINQLERAGDQMIASQQAGLTARGFADLDLNLLEDTASKVQQEVLNVQADTELTVNSLLRESELSREQAGDVKKAALFGAFGNILSGAGSFAKFGGKTRGEGTAPASNFTFKRNP